MNNWYECKVRYDKEQAEGAVKSVSESYLIDAYSVTEAETRLRTELEPFTSLGEMVISSVKKEKIAELFLSDSEMDDKYYRCRVNFISIDEKRGVEKKKPMTMIVKAGSLVSAVSRLDKALREGMVDTQIASVVETNIMDVFTADLTAKN